MRTIKEIAQILDVEPIVAYGLLRFMKDKGCAIEGKVAHRKGRKGKPAATYSFDHTGIEKLVDILRILIRIDRSNYEKQAEQICAVKVNPEPEHVSA